MSGRLHTLIERAREAWHDRRTVPTPRVKRYIAVLVLFLGVPMALSEALSLSGWPYLLVLYYLITFMVGWGVSLWREGGM